MPLLVAGAEPVATMDSDEREIAGVPVVEDGHLVAPDLEEKLARHRRAARRIPRLAPLTYGDR